MKKRAYLLLLLISLGVNLFAKEKNADDLIKTMKKADITYAQLMTGMGMAINNIQVGIISMNKLLVERGIDFIRTHPAPRKKPWYIMVKEDREAFKSSLVYFDKKMDEDILLIEKAVQKNDWSTAVQGLNTFNNTCISCHISWKDKVKYIMD